ncbi:DJ-1/PfpI family protein [Paraburkholderia sp.]|uniref:DJ-1/PfpI family protein n=1 Tax=Paraburkholderia sp. TaxID=1926495 RepID=UPI003D6E5A18
MSNIATRTAGFLLYPNVTQLDLTGPFEVLSRLPGWKTEIVAASRAPVHSDRGLVIQPDTSFAEAGDYDLFVVPGGPGTDDAMLDAATVAFIRERGQRARYVFGICTGSLLLGAAGLLRGRRAGTHWQSRDLLAKFGATPSADRLTVDGNLFTSGGVTAGIDMALRVAAEVAGDDVAQQIQLQIEYDPEPPFNAGSPDVAPRAIVEQVVAASVQRIATRTAAVERAAAALG